MFKRIGNGSLGLPRRYAGVKVIGLLLLFTLHFTLYTAASAASISATITLISGSVEVKTADTWKKAEKNMTLNEKDEIRTGAGGRVVLTLSDGSRMNLQENSSLVLTALGQNNVQLALNAGTMNTKVKKMGAGGKFSVDTPASVCAVRGTSFKVKATENETSVECYRGSVGVGKKDTPGEVFISRWEKILVSQDQTLGSAVTMNKEERSVVLAPVINEMSQEVRMGMSREAVQAAAAQEIKKAEYQQGKSLIDAFGKRVRLEEYIVRPQGTTDRFKMVVLNERESRFDYFTWIATFKDGAGNVAVLPTDLTQATKWLSWENGSTKPDYYLSSNETAASNTVDAVEYGWTGGHITGTAGNYEHLYDVYYFKINNADKISYQPKSGTGITNLATDVNYFITGNPVGNYISTTDRDNYIALLNTQLPTSQQITVTGNNDDYCRFLTWWNKNVASTKSGNSEVWDNRLQANFGGSLYNEDYYMVDDNGNKATLDEMNSIYDFTAGSYVKSELLKWNQELVMSGDDFTGPEGKIDLVVEPKIFIDAGIIEAK